MYDKIGHRFPVETYLTDASAFNSLSWPNGNLDLTMHGSNEIVALRGLLSVLSETSLEILSDFTVFNKRTNRIGARLVQLKTLVQLSGKSTYLKIGKVSLECSGLRGASML